MENADLIRNTYLFRGIAADDLSALSTITEEAVLVPSQTVTKLIKFRRYFYHWDGDRRYCRQRRNACTFLAKHVRELASDRDRRYF